MNENYLWDKSGEPDEEVQHLEMLLSEFRYQPRPLVLPEATPKRLIFSYATARAVGYAALAATVLFALGLGLWFGLRREQMQGQLAAQPASATPSPKTEVTPAMPVEPRVQRDAPQVVKQFAAPKMRAIRVHQRAPRRSLEAEGELAKEKVLYALQITSKQLDLISRKIQTDTN